MCISVTLQKSLRVGYTVVFEMEKTVRKVFADQLDKSGKNRGIKLIVKNRFWERILVDKIIVFLATDPFVGPSLPETVGIQSKARRGGGHTTYKGSLSRLSLLVPTSRVTAIAFDGSIPPISLRSQTGRKSIFE